MLVTKVASEAKYQGVRNPLDDMIPRIALGSNRLQVVKRGIFEFPEQCEDPLVRKVMALNPYLNQIVCVGLYYDKSDTEVDLIGDEKKLLENFWEAIFDERQFISFNGLGFDIPVIITRCMILEVDPPMLGTNSHPFLSRPKYRKNIHFDVACWASDWNFQYRTTLAVLCEAVGVPSPKEGAVKADGVEAAYKAGNIEEIKKYCLRDCRSTYQVAEIVSKYVSNQI